MNRAVVTPIAGAVCALTLFAPIAARSHVANVDATQPTSATQTAMVSANLAPNAATSFAEKALSPISNDEQTRLVKRYLTALQNAAFNDAFALLNPAARAYYRDAQNLRSVYVADAYRIEHFALIGMRPGGANGSVFFARETARFRDHAHDADLLVTATVPVGVVPDRGGWRIKDPGHPWRALATATSADVAGLHVTVKKLSFFARRIEAVVTFTNRSPAFVTLLPYGKSILRDAAGTPYRIIETRDWALTDKTLFEGLRLAPNARYTGMLAFACNPLDNAPRVFSLTLAPLLGDGTDAPFSIEVAGIGAGR